MSADRIIAFVMAGGQGSRLQPLTSARSKPSVPFGSRYRIVDFVLSNLINSQIRTIYLLVQYKSQSLIEHVRKAWTISPLLQDQFVTVVPPQMRTGSNWFQGTADAVNQNINLLEEHAPDLVVVFGADHIYRMDIRQMIDFHKEREADATIAALPVPLEEAKSFGVIVADEDGRISGFQEKPVNPSPMPGDPNSAFASMGNYVFDTKVLLNALYDSQQAGETDFGQHVLPRLLAGGKRLFSYDFSTNEIPNIKPYEARVYWRDVGGIDAYFNAHKDVLGAEPVFDAFNPDWPIYSSNYQGPVARVLGGQVTNSLLGAATVIHENTRISNSIIRREAVIEEDVELEDCIIMDYVRVCRGARLRRVIVDRHNIIDPGTVIGYDPDADKQRFNVSPGGVTVVPSGLVGFFARDTRGTGRGYSE
ncbi:MULTISPECIES: glucose-1-phosphate adenylyltransferase [Thiorhodovibrio]|uniref:glucose-1-phosphate adenylyltransferase n=1 Tax=Thiorhodovibrio TaxID=61593 RepID=UPI001911479A|nr:MULTISPECIES: glucose-1-phosphate adenylyltransferase [Thiorhodovibrio]MBK5967697.1 glucose-1-phosphate adenylyltransferase [Thiorhodovibrio winogradskyi]WPL11645.1 Glucose-1-phosphate adenylyltransferase [Thiorhodovibrio litoralis]